MAKLSTTTCHPISFAQIGFVNSILTSTLSYLCNCGLQLEFNYYRIINDRNFRFESCFFSTESVLENSVANPLVKDTKKKLKEDTRCRVWMQSFEVIHFAALRAKSSQPNTSQWITASFRCSRQAQVLKVNRLSRQLSHHESWFTIANRNFHDYERSYPPIFDRMTSQC